MISINWLCTSACVLSCFMRLFHSQTKTHGSACCSDISKNAQHSTGATACKTWGKTGHTHALESETLQVVHHHVFYPHCLQVQHSYPEPLAECSLGLDPVERGPAEQNSFSNIPHEGKHTPLYERSSPNNSGQAGSSNHTEAAFFNASSTSSSSENEESSGTTAKWVQHKAYSLSWSLFTEKLFSWWPAMVTSWRGHQPCPVISSSKFQQQNQSLPWISLHITFHMKYDTLIPIYINYL